MHATSLHIRLLAALRSSPSSRSMGSSAATLQVLLLCNVPNIRRRGTTQDYEPSSCWPQVLFCDTAFSSGARFTAEELKGAADIEVAVPSELRINISALLPDRMMLPSRRCDAPYSVACDSAHQASVHVVHNVARSGGNLREGRACAMLAVCRHRCAIGSEAHGRSHPCRQVMKCQARSLASMLIGPSRTNPLTIVPFTRQPFEADHPVWRGLRGRRHSGGHPEGRLGVIAAECQPDSKPGRNCE